ncbi:MAG: hypothetical protein JO019_01905 [Candidatus Kaiserbacteria bacterium]|nr:hypothetical protein [Candidatus Kaiserbacteria bacterium]
MFMISEIVRALRNIGWFLLRFLMWFTISTVVWFVIVLFIVFYQNAIEGDVYTSGAYSGDHFTVIYDSVPEKSAELVEQDLERNRQRIMDDFGVESMPHVIVRLYPPGSREFRDAGINISADTNGFVHPATLDTIHLLWKPQRTPWHVALTGTTDLDVLEKNAQHEFAHLVMYNLLYEDALAAREVTSRANWEYSCKYTGLSFCKPLDSWLDEGLAQYESGYITVKTIADYPDRADTLAPTTFTGDDRYIFGDLVGEYIVERWGKAGLKKIVEDRGDLIAAFGESDDEFNSGFRAFARPREAELMQKYGDQIGKSLQ